jgi:NADP-dependent 3-hydroxy acid dehydrogenase YdfG
MAGPQVIAITGASAGIRRPSPILRTARGDAVAIGARREDRLTAFGRKPLRPACVR